MLKYLLIGGFIGFFLGVVCTVVLLCKKNLEQYSEIQAKATEKVKQNYEAAKALYNAEINGSDADETEDEAAFDGSDTGQPADGSDFS